MQAKSRLTQYCIILMNRLKRFFLLFLIASFVIVGLVFVKQINAVGIAATGTITVVPPAISAIGTITLVPKANLVDGETFDYWGNIFEFDVDGDGVEPGHLLVDVSSAIDAIDVAFVVGTAIENASIGIVVTDNLDGTLDLETVGFGSDQNYEITDTVADEGFIVTGMSGGTDGILDGETVTISFELESPVIFEFDINDNVVESNIQVDISSANTAEDVATALVNTINGAAAPELTAEGPDENSTLTIANGSGNGSLGNVPITTNVGAAGFEVSGMSGGSDTAPPTIDISVPSLSTASSTSSVTYTITYEDAVSVTLASGDITLNTTGTATGTVGFSGTGTSTRTVAISGISGNGTLGITIASGTASNEEGDASAAGPSTTFTVDNTGPIFVSGALSRVSDTEFSVDIASDVATSTLTNNNDGGFTVTEKGGSATYVVFSTHYGGLSKTYHKIHLVVAITIPSAAKGITATYVAGGNGRVVDNVGNPMATDAVGKSFNAWATAFDPSDPSTVFTVDGGDPESTTLLTATTDVSATTTSSAGDIEVIIPIGTEITKDDNSAFDATAATSTDATNVILGSSLMTAGVTLQGAVQFGISGTTLHFSNPVIVRIPVIVPNGTVLDIRRSPDGGATWTTAGFTASATDTCLNGNGNHPVTTTTIAGGYATIFTCQASDFATYSYSQPSSSYYYGGGGGTLTTITATSTATTTITTTATTTASTTPSLTLQDLLASPYRSTQNSYLSSQSSRDHRFTSS